MANTFLAARGIDVGKSLAEHEMTGTANEILQQGADVGCEIVLPVDVVVARELKAGAASQTVPVDGCPPDAMILDAGPKTVERISAVFDAARTLIWNGPLGAFEIPPFDAATNAAAPKAAELTRQGHLVSVAGGGDTVAALNTVGRGRRLHLRLDRRRRLPRMDGGQGAARRRGARPVTRLAQPLLAFVAGSANRAADLPQGDTP